jgi:SET domain-containing protein
MYELNRRWTIDGSSRANIARYANHSCRPNAESDVANGKVILRAIKTILPGREITYDYGREYFELIIKPRGCKCAHCGGKRTAPPYLSPKGRGRIANGSGLRPAR